MKKFNKLLLAGTALAATAMTVVAVASPDGGCGRDMRPGMHQGMGPGMHKGMHKGDHQGMRKGMGRGMGFKLDRIPNLTDEQREQLTALRQEQQAAMEGFRAAMQERRKEMKAKFDAILTEEQREAMQQRGGMYRH